MNGIHVRITLARKALEGGKAFLEERARMKAAGTWEPATAHYIAQGAKKYVVAIANGDLASENDIRFRQEQCCAGCPSRVPHPEHPETRMGTCGPAFVDRCAEEDNPTCGCPIEVMTMVASHACPQKKFLAAPRVGAS